METVRDWLKQFPQIQIVSRDGSLAYKDAITQANPKIEQILDRWHVLKNAKDALLEWLKTTIPATIKWIQLSESAKVTEIKTELEIGDINQEKWRIQLIQQERKEGKSIARLARNHELTRMTIYKYLKTTEPPPKIRTRARPSSKTDILRVSHMRCFFYAIKCK